MNSNKTPYIIYADLATLIKKIDECANNPEKSSTTKIPEHTFWRYSRSTIRAFGNIEQKHTLYRGEDSMRQDASGCNCMLHL